MNTVAKEVGRDDGAPVSVRGVTQQPSKIFGSLYRLLDVNHRLNILEVGTALPETVEFFSRYKCRIHFLDLFSDPLLGDLQNVTSQQEIQQHFTELLTFPAGTKLDICLFWDFLCFLDDPALKAFNEALRPYVRHGTRAHGFGIHHLAIRLGNKQYGVIDANTLSVRPRQTKQADTHPHSQVEMYEMMSCFDFERGLLLPAGKLELLLKAREDALDN